MLVEANLTFFFLVVLLEAWREGKYRKAHFIRLEFYLDRDDTV